MLGFKKLKKRAEIIFILAKLLPVSPPLCLFTSMLENLPTHMHLAPLFRALPF